MGRSESVRGASGRSYALRSRRDLWGSRQWYVGSEGSWGAPFLDEPQARQWARAH